MSTKLNLRIHSLKCLDETGELFYERFGTDEIYLGGFYIDAKAQVKKISPFLIDFKFDDSSVKKYNPPMICASYTLDPNFTQPVKYYAGFLIFKRESGDGGIAVQKLYEKVTEEIQKEKNQLPDLFASGISITVGAAIFDLIWAAVKPPVNNYLINTIAPPLHDKIFPLRGVTTTLINIDHTWNGKKTSPVSDVEFIGHQGIYQLVYDWELR